MADLRTLARSIAPKRADSFLQAVLNLDLSDEKTALHFLEKFNEFLPRFNFKLGIGPVLIGQGHKLDPLKEVRRMLAMAWQRPTVLSRQLCILQLLATYVSLNGFEVEKATYEGDEFWAGWLESRVDPFSLVGLRALQIADRMRYCPNPTCPSPYFIAYRRSQKYCTDACALPAQRELKRAWWKEHGEQWRQKRKKRARPKKGVNRRAGAKEKGKRGK